MDKKCVLSKKWVLQQGVWPEQEVGPMPGSIGQGGQQTLPLISLLQRARYFTDPCQDGDIQDALFPLNCEVTRGQHETRNE